jgi:hypothetical protein
LKGYRDKQSNLYIIPVFIHNKKIVSNKIEFVVDTGASQTTLSIRDAINLNLLSFNDKTFELMHNFDFEIEKTHTGNGIIDVLKLDEVFFTFYVNETSYFVEYLNKIHIIKPIIKIKEDYDAVIDSPSVLGMDILKNYKIQFVEDMVLLER